MRGLARCVRACRRWCVGPNADTLSKNAPPPASEARLWGEALGERLARGERVVVRTEGHSMWPALRNGRHVVVRPLARGGVRCGDVVLATIGGRPVLHRVVGVRRGAVLLKGDARPRPDGWVPRGAVVGAIDPGVWPGLVATASRLGGAPLARVLGWLRRRSATGFDRG